MSERLRLRIDRLRGFREIFEQRGAKPAFGLRVVGKAIPRPAEVAAEAVESCRTGEGSGREEEAEAGAGVGNVFYESVDHLRNARDEGLAGQTGGGVVEHPRTTVPVGLDDQDRVGHGATPLWSVGRSRSDANSGFSKSSLGRGAKQASDSKGLEVV